MKETDGPSGSALWAIAIGATLGILLLLLASSGCGPRRVRATQTDQMNAIMQAWMGHPVSEVIQRKGPATRAVPDGKGGTIYTWTASSTSTRTRSVPYTQYGTIERTGPSGEYIGEDTTRTTRTRTYTTTVTHSAFMEFWADKDGIIYYWRWQSR